MHRIQTKHITAGLASAVMFALCLALGCLNRLLWIPAVGFLAAFLYIHRTHLKCPHCGGFINLDRLLYAKTHVYHCNHCGNLLEIEK